MNNQKIKHLVSSCSLVVLLSLLTGCDNTDYKTRIQKENDDINPNGNRAICLRVGKIFNDMYPYTIHYLEGEINPKDRWDKIAANNDVNLKLSLYAKEGLFTEELVGYDGDKPLYRYDLTDEGRKYLDKDWWGGTNFCFGRVVVERIQKVDYQLKNMPMVHFSYHMENVPNWIKNPEIYRLYEGHGSVQSMGKGKRLLTGLHYYSKKSDGTLRLRKSVSGFYIL
ncbi:MULTISPECIES: hypothetical protein [unclassified Gilliamella]|uniref:hypothetical protein n=1 Tax=unclassified Gilliamella TaxID=2685620 RepID=UPI0013091D90|nr:MULTISPECIES: hypothetical protein [unclassified Gilliamella]MWP50323.1 hypothetical protein [Gilliamella sp. Lep-s35]MWP70037.1 hypothetical protein [Gilliamella sp. Lep-s5]MWP78274.1 hypothetical protein [Gilliamella sp. Lep-s21]